MSNISCEKCGGILGYTYPGMPKGQGYPISGFFHVTMDSAGVAQYDLSFDHAPLPVAYSVTANWFWREDGEHLKVSVAKYRIVHCEHDGAHLALRADGSIDVLRAADIFPSEDAALLGELQMLDPGKESGRTLKRLIEVELNKRGWVEIGGKWERVS